MMQQIRHWTNPSVLAFAPESDPVQAIQARAKDVVLEAAEQGWNGPPFDPFHLAELLGIQVFATDDVFDARTVPVGSEDLRIEYNPNRPHGRMRYSIAHEIAHTLFPDCAEAVRNRTQGGRYRDDEWQLELLCNIGAAELLMPTGFADLESESIDIENLLQLRSKFDVSTEALFLRVVKLTSHPCAMFAAARTREAESGTYRVDYNVSSRSWSTNIPAGFEIKVGTVLSDCTAVGYTAKGSERWNRSFPTFNVECVGIPAFPGQRFPRVVGILTPESSSEYQEHRMLHVFGDALEPRGDGTKVIAHIVNDRTPNWGGGFALEVRKKWRFVQDDFRKWVNSDPSNLSLGKAHVTRIRDDLYILHMVAQSGYGRASRPRIRYLALRESLIQLAQLSLQHGASVHMPRIGTGNAGGNWRLIGEMIDETLVRNGVRVVVYDLPDSTPPENQGVLSL